MIASGRAFNTPSITGSNRACSSSALTRGSIASAHIEPGRVLSAPRSSKSRPLVQQRECMFDGELSGAKKHSAVAKGVRRNVYHAHHACAITQRERARAQSPVL